MFKIKSRNIGPTETPYIIAELSANHNGSIDLAKKTIKSAKDNGAHAVKIQTYEAHTMTIKSNKDDFIIKGGLWDGYNLYDLYDEAKTPFKWHEELFRYANKIGIDIFSSPFDESAVDLLESLNTPAYKVASFELVDIPLIKYIAKTGKPILMSTGMSSEEEISEAIEAARSNGANDILIFHCISSYPAPIEHANLNMIPILKKRFNVEVGLSDHTLSNLAATLSVAKGAVAIEKHFILDRSLKGPDSEFSMEPSQLSSLVSETQNAWKAMGGQTFSRADVEKGSLVFRRSIYFVKDLKKGSIIKKEDIRRIRPGYGLKPKYFDQIIGRKTTSNVEAGDPVAWDLIEE
ncbi:pseudaminic acid synthase [Gammaproteobacteria bacterium]|nr:pseudaminic acid synthase [Gammaproteobacteria bacterium]